MSEPLWTAEELVRATGGRVVGEAVPATGVSFDSRSIETGDLFVALEGVRDGHEFVAGAFEKGAACALVSRPLEGAGPQIVVGDTLKGLEDLAVFARMRAPAKRAAVTGSVGKTSTTQAIYAGLLLAGHAHGSIKSFNNHIGVPLTVARMPRETKRAVFEIGMNHADEIRPLSKVVRPHVALINNVGPVHVENFPDGEHGVARAKAEIFEGLEPGGVAVLNADGRWFEFLRGEAERLGVRVVSFGTGAEADGRLLQFDAEEARAQVRVVLHGRALDFTLLQTGLHWGLNSLAVLLVLEGLGVPVETGVEALSAFEPLAGRGAEKVVAMGGGAFRLIDESYNANPISMRAALATLGRRPVHPPGRRIVALTDMLELGGEAEAFHASLAEPIEEAGISQVFLAGPLMKALWDSLPAARQGAYASSAAELAPQLVEAVRPGDVVMVKGSNGSKASTLAAALAQAPAPRETA
ncbi:MAG TPA: UDP-N-acetylmuramoyl-tripeptide--D-alanyl-D-alanine ligase [Caulobacteraceae bacterium]